MKQLRHVLALTLVFCMVFGMVTPSLAVSGEISVEEDYGIPVEEDGGIEIEVDDRSDYDIDEDREELSVLPKQDETADETNTTGKVDGYNYNIIHLDCGRKYFSVDSIKKIIDNASAAGFNYIQLAVGNDGMRFLLDDMSLTVNGTTYDSNAVSTAIHAGNEAYYNFDIDELTQSEMDAIIEYAYTKGMGVIPLINTPGHMDAILAAATSLTGTNCAYDGSKRTIDVTNPTAVAFTKAFLTKYITYFAGKGCTLFNMGADEYANDRYTGGSMGFGNLQSTEKYGYFVTYVNEVAELIKNAGMKPMAFNDGIYFNNNTSSGTFDTDIIIEYWSSGWGTYLPMSAYNLAAKGFKMVNTNGSYYWVLGKTDAQCSPEKARGFDKTVFPGSTISNPGGSTFCIWSDYPGAETEASVITKTADTIEAFGGTLPTVDSVTNGGTTDPAGETVEITLNVGESTTRTINGVAVSGTGYGDNYALVEALDSSVAGATTYAQATSIGSLGANEEGYYISYDGTHFMSYNGSDIVNSTSNPTKWNITKSGNQYIISTDYNGKTYYLVGKTSGLSLNTSLSLNTKKSNATKWNFDADYGFYYTTSNYFGTTYNYIYYYSRWYDEYWTVGDNNTNHGLPYTKTTTTAQPKTTVTITGKAPTADLANGCITAVVGNGDNAVTYNITVNAIEETKSLTVSSGKTAALNVPALDESIVGTTTTTFDVTIGSEYITVNENGTITAGTVTEDKTATVVAKVKNAGGIVLATYTYNVTITKEDLTEVTPITVEYWITNSRLTGTESNKDKVTITAQEAFGEGGVDIGTLVDAMGAKDGRTQEYWQSKILDVEKTNTSTSGTELQTTKEGDDETLNGSAFTKIRYYNSKWQVYTTEWTDVNRTQVTVGTYTGDKNQLVAYYMEVVDINNANRESELHVNAADWGSKGNGGQFGFINRDGYCSVSVQIVYEDNTTNPTDTTANNLKSKTIVYGYWNGGRGLGTMIFSGQQNYQIYKVTAETGDMTNTMGSSGEGYPVTVTSFTWDKNEETVWEGDATKSVSIGNPARNPSYVAPYDNLAWNTSEYNNNNAILIRVYVKAAATEDSLKVNYVDKGTGTNFYNYNITVEEGITFNAGFALENGALVNNTVVNYNGVTQTVNSNLKEMPEISSYYRFSNFTLEEVKRSTDGKEVWLYYTFNNRHDFVVDFGVPLHLDPVDIGLGNDSEGNNWDTVKFNDKNELNYGTANVKKDEGLDYYPNVIMTGVETIAVDLSVSSNPNDEPATHFIYLYPATNVLYEENVITNPGTEWTTVNDNNYALPGGVTTQSAEKLGEENLHGYDDYYSENTGFSGGSAYKATLDASKTATEYGKPLTFEFTGNGFDLISECGPQTGALLVRVYKDEVLNHGFFVDTYFTGDNTGIINSADANGVLDYQVPVVRDINLEHGTYKVEVYGYMVNRNTTSTASLYSVDSAETYLEQALKDLGLDDDASLYEVSFMDENSVLNDNAVASDVVRSGVSVQSMADEVMAATDNTQYVYVDGIRVYGTLENNPGYTAKEVNTKYYNVYDFALNSSAGVSDKWDNNSLIYVEKDGNKNLFTIADYKKQGPENEIYLTSGNAVAFVLDGYSDINSTVHISAKAVSGAPIFNGQEVLTNTEMYYDVSELVLSDEKYGKYIVLKNDAVDDTVLSISGIKVSSNIELIANADFGEFIVKELTPAQDDEFKPETFKASIPKSVKKNRKFSISASASADVQEVVVKDSDGNVIISKTQDKANNSSSPYRYSLLVTAPNISGNYSVKVYAKDVNGKLSAPIELTIEVK